METRGQRTSLHAFWRLPGAGGGGAPVGVEVLRVACEDCDGVVEVAEEEAAGCGGCGRRVCDGCSMEREGRVCLECACVG